MKFWIKFWSINFYVKEQRGIGKREIIPLLSHKLQCANPGDAPLVVRLVADESGLHHATSMRDEGALVPPKNVAQQL